MRENVQLALLSHAAPRARASGAGANASSRGEADALLASVGMQAQAERAMSVLAYGDVKRVELAIALANRPRLLLMDEPTAGMAPRERNELMALARRLAHEQSIGVLFTEHSMDVVFAHADRIIVLARGELIAEGPPAAVRDDARVREVYFGGGTTFARRRRRRTRPMLEVAVARCLVRPGAGALRRLARRRRRRMRRPGRPQRRRQVDDDEGDHGPDGAPARPRRLPRHATSRRCPRTAIGRLGLGWVPEDRRIFTDLSVRENLEVGAPAAARRRADLDAEDKLYALFPNLAAMPDRPGGRMSGGEQQMLTVARTLMGNPYLVLLDEPSEGVAPLIVEEMARMIVALKAAGVAILLSEQNLHFARLVSDRAVVLEKGEVKFDGTMEALMSDEALLRAHLSV